MDEVLFLVLELVASIAEAAAKVYAKIRHEK